MSTDNDGCSEEQARMLAVDQALLAKEAAGPDAVQTHRKMADGLLFAADAMALLSAIEQDITLFFVKQSPKDKKTPAAVLLRKIWRGAIALLEDWPEGFDPPKDWP